VRRQSARFTTTVVWCRFTTVVWCQVEHSTVLIFAQIFHLKSEYLPRGRLGRICGNRIGYANLLIAFHSNYGSIFLSFWDMSTGQTTDLQRQPLYIWPLTLYGHIKPAQQQQLWWLIHWPLMGGLLHLVQRGGAWACWGTAQSPRCCTKCNSPPINGQCTKFVFMEVALS